MTSLKYRGVSRCCDGVTTKTGSRNSKKLLEPHDGDAQADSASRCWPVLSSFNSVAFASVEGCYVAVRTLGIANEVLSPPIKRVAARAMSSVT